MREPTSHAPRAWWLEPAKYAPIAWRPSESRHARSTARPALSPCRSSILIFLAGGIQKRNGRQEAGAALPFVKRKRTGFKYKWSLAIQSSLRNGEAQICMRLPQTLPCARNHPRRF